MASGTTLHCTSYLFPFAFSPIRLGIGARGILQMFGVAFCDWSGGHPGTVAVTDHVKGPLLTSPLSEVSVVDPIVCPLAITVYRVALSTSDHMKLIGELTVPLVG